MKAWHKKKGLNYYRKCLNLISEGLIDMVEKYDYSCPEAEDDNLDEILKEAHEGNKNKTVEELDAE